MIKNSFEFKIGFLVLTRKNEQNKIKNVEQIPELTLTHKNEINVNKIVIVFVNLKLAVKYINVIPRHPITPLPFWKIEINVGRIIKKNE